MWKRFLIFVLLICRWFIFNLFLFNNSVPQFAHSVGSNESEKKNAQLLCTRVTEKEGNLSIITLVEEAESESFWTVCCAIFFVVSLVVFLSVCRRFLKFLLLITPFLTLSLTLRRLEAREPIRVHHRWRMETSRQGCFSATTRLECSGYG
jgi:hypothetical protein